MQGFIFYYIAIKICKTIKKNLRQWKLFYFLCLLTLSILGCDKPEQISPEREQLLEEYKEVDLKITSYLGTLAALTTQIEERKKVICEEEILFL